MVGVQINLGQWPSPHSHHQCTLVAEALVIIPVVTAMGGESALVQCAKLDAVHRRGVDVLHCSVVQHTVQYNTDLYDSIRTSPTNT